ncbi:unnamed protein product [Vicia faba]|uniref:Uncharacterized protein n=1 Tax=Vicia faba TaxID=3906 RepID=A0AAV1AWT8_VICFA|nr:unnamed protein product [Vicia faba]
MTTHLVCHPLNRGSSQRHDLPPINKTPSRYRKNSFSLSQKLHLSPKILWHNSFHHRRFPPLTSTFVSNHQFRLSLSNRHCDATTKARTKIRKLKS